MKATLHTPEGTLTLDVPAEAIWSPQSAARALREAGAPPAFVGALGRLLAAAAEVKGVSITLEVRDA